MGRLIEGEDAGGPRWFLDNEPVHCGTPLEIHLADRWQLGRFETGDLGAYLCLKLADTQEELLARVPATAELRWPK